MPERAIELTYEKIIEAASKLSEDEKEHLFFSLNKDYAKALDEMRKEAWKSHQQGESVQFIPLSGGEGQGEGKYQESERWYWGNPCLIFFVKSVGDSRSFPGYMSSCSYLWMFRILFTFSS